MNILAQHVSSRNHEQAVSFREQLASHDLPGRNSVNARFNRAVSQGSPRGSGDYKPTVKGNIYYQAAIAETIEKCKQLRKHLEIDDVNAALRNVTYLSWMWQQTGVYWFSRVFLLIRKAMLCSTPSRTRVLIDEVEYRVINLTNWLMLAD